MGLPEQACEVCREAANLNKGEMFLLLKSYSDDKGPETRIFDPEEAWSFAERRKVNDAAADTTFEECREYLADKAMIVDSQSIGIATRTDTGNTIAHCFREAVQRPDILSDEPSSALSSVERMTDIRDAICRLCDGQSDGGSH